MWISPQLHMTRITRSMNISNKMTIFHKVLTPKRTPNILQVMCSRQLSSEGDPQYEAEGERLYPHHIPTSSLQKLVLAGGSALAALADPWRADMVAVNGEVGRGLYVVFNSLDLFPRQVTGLPALRHMHSAMKAGEEGRRVLELRPRITSSILPVLAELPPSSLGFQYQAFLTSHNITPDSRYSPCPPPPTPTASGPKLPL